MLTEETRHQILELQKLYPGRRSALLPALHLAQAELGHLPSEAQAEIAELFAIEPGEVHAVVTFYDMFFEEPRGKHLLYVCKNLSCMLRGADQLIEKFCQRLNINPGETSANKEFTLVPSECLGACDCAPAMLIDEELVGPVYAEDVDRLVVEIHKGAVQENPEGGHA